MTPAVRVYACNVVTYGGNTLRPNLTPRKVWLSYLDDTMEALRREDWRLTYDDTR